MEKKICIECKNEKSLIDFVKKRNSGTTCHSFKCKEYRKHNEKKIKQKQKQWYENNKEYLIDKSKKWIKNNPEKRLQIEKKYRKNNIKIINERYNIYYKKRSLKDEMFNITRRLRSRVNGAFRNKSWVKNGGTEKLLGTTFKNAFKHIELQFKEGMSWDNRNEWHIDHIIPLASAKTEEELIKLCRYTNLQPLWAEDNLKKGSTYNEKAMEI